MFLLIHLFYLILMAIILFDMADMAGKRLPLHTQPAVTFGSRL